VYRAVGDTAGGAGTNSTSAVRGAIRAGGRPGAARGAARRARFIRHAFSERPSMPFGA